MRNVVIAIVILALIGLGVYFVVNNKSNNKPAASNSSSNQSPSSNNANNNQPASDSVTIIYSDNGFSPNSATLKAGGKLTVTNTSTLEVQFDSDPHPVHTDNQQLNIGSINPGESKTVTLTNTGTWGYHNHLDPSQTGTLIVK